MDCRQAMKDYMDQEIEVMGKLDLDESNDAINAIMDCRERGGTVYTMGNGGSAATAGHLVCDFAKGLSEELGGKKFRFECLCDNTSLVMAIANDISYEEVFAFQLKGKLRPEDLVIAISGSGRSRNVLRAVEYAKEVGTPVIGMTGYDGGMLKGMSDFRMHVPVDNIQISEDIHMMFDHMLLNVMSRCGWKAGAAD